MKFHAILKSKIEDWKFLEKQIESLTTTTERGDVFEEFIYVYFCLKKGLYQIREIYREKDIPLKYRKKFQFEKRDCGVDGLIIFQNGKSAAYQAKFRTGRNKPSYAELTKFWIEANFTDYHYTIANCSSLSELCLKHPKHKGILVSEFDDLPSSFFNEFHQFTNAKKVVREYYKPDIFQKRMVRNVIRGFQSYDRGKLIAASGTGKTLMALWISELMKSKKVLFLTPSLSLLKQTLESWSYQSINSFSYLCVCSDKTVSGEVDNGDIRLFDLNIPVTTSPDVICNYLLSKRREKQIIFSTYQSLDSVLEGINKLENFHFDLMIFDEAHRTAGAKSSGLFSLGLEDRFIPSRKRLFMTATERLVRPWILEKAKRFERIVFSMDDIRLYGPIFDIFTFGQAIKNNIISDYRIVVAGIREKEIYDWIKNNTLLVQVEKSTQEYYTYARNIFSQILLVKSMYKFSARKCITFHNTIKGAHAFIMGSSSDELTLIQIFQKLLPKLSTTDLYLEHINGKMTAGKRKAKLDMFKESKFGVISNSRCLTEGVDVPVIDSIYFVNAKNSLVDIVQACGRALRKPRDGRNKIAYFIVPVLIPEGSVKGEIINKIDFEMLHNLIQSLRDQDQRLAQWIDRINLSSATGEIYKFTEESDSPIFFDMPTKFNIKDFEQELYLKIAEVNKDPTSVLYKTQKYGKGDRKSQCKRIFKTLGDYAVDSYKNNLVMPTISKFISKNKLLSPNKIRINHNNVSHTERLGLIIKEGKCYKLSPLGCLLFDNKIDFESIFQQQMLRYYTTISDEYGIRILFPYRMFLKILLQANTIDFVEFVFSMYSLMDYSEVSLFEAVENVKYLRNKFHNLGLLNETNKRKVLRELNEYFVTNFSATEVWTKQTTIYNQYIYFRNHLSLLDGIIKTDKVKIGLIKGSERKLRLLLLQNARMESKNNLSALRNEYIQPPVKFFLFNLKNK